MGTDQGSSRAGTVAGTVILVAIGGALLYGSGRFLLDVRDGRSPGVLTWVAMGLLLFFLGASVAVGVGKLFHADEDATTTVAAVIALVVVAGGLGLSYYWVHIREPALVKTLGAACRGTAVAAAPSPAGARRIVVLDDRGHRIDWTTTDAAWRAEKVTEADLVACVDRTEETVETCTYRPLTGVATTNIDRVEEVLTVRMVEARTAAEVGRFELRGTPRACKKVEEQGQGDLHGHVAFATFAEALAPYRG